MKDSNAWRPAADLEMARKRASLYQKIRRFMSDREILEVDTPIISRYAITDPYIESLQAVTRVPALPRVYLHTSPEFCMKRLLAAGFGDIYQLAHVFRDAELGKRHTLEFVMLEWYRTGMDYLGLMEDVAELLVLVGLPEPDRQTYRDAFLEAVAIDPITAETGTLLRMAREAGWEQATPERHALLDFLLSHVVFKQIKNKKNLIIYDYPACMAALAKLKTGQPELCERFEVFVDGMEIANGFTELTDATEQRERFTADLETRRKYQADCPPVDEYFLEALEAGLPDSAGVAVGVDRLLMVLTGHEDIAKVNCFTLANN